MSDEQVFSLESIEQQYDRLPKIVVMGVGGGGCNAVNHMVDRRITGVEFVAVNTDIRSLRDSRAQIRLQIGKSATKGLGAGTSPEVGRVSAEESGDDIRTALKEVQLLFLTTGMGGGTGSGATPVIAKIAKEMDILTIAVVTKPFRHEGEIRTEVAEQGINELRKYVDTMIVLPNEHLFKIADKDTSLAESLAASNDVLCLGVKGITDLITVPGVLNDLDFADVRMVVKKMGRAMMGTGEAMGENRAVKAVDEALSNPLLEDVSISGAAAVLVSVVGPPSMTLLEYEEAARRIKEAIGPGRAVIKIGSALSMDEGDKVRVSIFATGMKDNKEDSKSPPPEKKHEIVAEKQQVKVDLPKQETAPATAFGQTKPINRTRRLLREEANAEILPVLDDEADEQSAGNLISNEGKASPDIPELTESNERNRAGTQRHIKLKNREIIIKTNAALQDSGVNEDLFAIPAYLRKNKKTDN